MQAQASHRKKEVALTLSSLETFSGQSSLFLSQQLVTKQEHKVMEELISRCRIQRSTSWSEEPPPSQAIDIEIYIIIRDIGIPYH